jgi:hypothetical protein
VIWQVAARRSTYKMLDKRSALYKAKRKIEKAKAQVRAKVEPPFRVIKRQFGYTKVRFRALAKIERVSRSWRAWLWPGSGNPEPSCLRTRPATQERIARLLTLAPAPASALPLRAPHFLPESALATRPPRWRPSGLWR